MDSILFSVGKVYDQIRFVASAEAVNFPTVDHRKTIPSGQVHYHILGYTTKNMYIYMYVCMYVCMYIYMYMYIYICIYIYVYIYVCMYVYIYMYIYMYIWVNYSISLTLKNMCIYIYVLYIHICMILLFYSFFPFYLQYIAIKKQYFQNISRSQYSHRLPMNFPPFQRRAPPGNPWSVDERNSIDASCGNRATDHAALVDRFKWIFLPQIWVPPGYST